MLSRFPLSTRSTRSTRSKLARYLLCSLAFLPLTFLSLGLTAASPAHAWFLAIDGSVAPLAQPLNGRFKVGGGGVVRSFLFEGSVSIIPIRQVTLYESTTQETSVDYPVFVGFETRYYFLSHDALTKRHDIYLALGADFPILAQSFVPGFKMGGGYALRVHRRVFLELGVDYYFYGALNNELFVGSGIKVVF